MKRLCLILSILLLAGCQANERVLEPLPAPYTPSRSEVTPSYQPPRPAPTLITPRLPTIGRVTIVVDAGHGGKDTGAPAAPVTRSQLPEKTIVLDIANDLARILAQRGAKVVQTRTTDRFISLEERADIAERNYADLFVSIHADSIEDASISGAAVHIYTNASTQSRKAAFSIVRALENAGINCRGVRHNDFHVLREHSRPAVLIECGFLTNAHDAGQLNTPAYRSRMANAIAEGIVQYFSQ